MILATPGPRSGLSRRAEWLCASVFLLAGLAIFAVACGWIAVDPARASTPRWVLAAAAAMFCAGGFVPMTIRLGADAWQTRLVGAIVLLALAAIFNWTAFGPGTRTFTSTFSLGGSLVDRAATSERTGRIIFGVAAALLDVFVIAVGVRWARRGSRKAA